MIVYTEKMPRRPVFERLLRRLTAYDWGSSFGEDPTEEEMADAIKVLHDCYPPIGILDDELLREAERIFIEAQSR